MPPLSVSERLARHPLFGLASDEVRQRLLSRGTRVYLEAGETLYVAGEQARQVFVLLEGIIQIELPLAGVQRGFVCALAPAPGFLGECQVLHGQPWSGTGVAVIPTTALGFDAETLEWLVMIAPEVALGLYRELSWRFLGAINSWKVQQLAAPDEALARYLLGLLFVLEGAQASTGGRLPVRQSEVGRATGLRRETVNRIFSRWVEEGVCASEPRGICLVRKEVLRGLLREEQQEVLVHKLQPAWLRPINSTEATVRTPPTPAREKAPRGRTLSDRIVLVPG